MVATYEELREQVEELIEEMETIRFCDGRLSHLQEKICEIITIIRELNEKQKYL